MRTAAQGGCYLTPDIAQKLANSSRDPLTNREREIAQLLAQGLSLAQAVDSLGHVAEGVYSARTVVQRARGLGVDMPISEAVVALLEGRLEPAQAVAALMGRDPKDEAL